MILPDWSRAECRRRGIPTRRFFYEDHFRRLSSPYKLARDAAKRICDACPIEDKCGDWAIETNQEGGVWGGMTDDERKRERKKRYRLAQLEILAESPLPSESYEWSR